MELRRFNEKGISTFRAYLEALREDPSRVPPFDLLDKPSLTTPLEEPFHADPKDFPNRMEFCRWLQNAADTSGARVPLRDDGFWAWLSLLLFDQVCPPKRGKRQPGDHVRYIVSADWRRRYRHLLATPYRIFHMHRDQPERAWLLLSQPLHVLGELTEQFASRQELISCPGTMALANRLFVTPESRKLRRGASGDAARRLGRLLNQYTRTWDIAVMDPAVVANMLPSGFSRFSDTN